MGTLAYCIQGKDTATKAIGCFMYSNNEPFKALSPVFPTLPELFAWLKDNGYETEREIASYRIFKSEVPT